MKTSRKISGYPGLVSAHSLKSLCFLLLFVCVLVSCGGKSGAASAVDNTLYIYNWTYYTPDSVIQKFEKEYNAKVVYDSFPSNEEMFAKIRAGGSDYDLCFPSGDYVAIMIKENMLEPIDAAKLENFKNIDPAVLSRCTFDPGNRYSIPYYMGAAGIAVNKTKVPNFDRSWGIFGRKDLAGKMVMLDDMREVLGDALAYKGKSVNSVSDSDLSLAEDVVNREWKPNLLKFDAEAFAKGFASGEFWVVQGYAESIYQEYPADKRDEIAFFIPKEGGPMYIDSMVILKGAKHKDLAMKFIDFIHRPENYAEFVDTFGFPATCNVPARALKKGPSWYKMEDLAPCELKQDLGADLQKYTDIWQNIRVGD